MRAHYTYEQMISIVNRLQRECEFLEDCLGNMESHTDSWYEVRDDLDEKRQELREMEDRLG